jgi:hypothetical protein
MIKASLLSDEQSRTVKCRQGPINIKYASDTPARCGGFARKPAMERRAVNTAKELSAPCTRPVLKTSRIRTVTRVPVKVRTRTLLALSGGNENEVRVSIIMRNFPFLYKTKLPSSTLFRKNYLCCKKVFSFRQLLKICPAYYPLLFIIILPVYLSINFIH